MGEPQSALVPVIVLTGYLGAGKTTLLKEALRQPEFANSALIVNEIGEVGIDNLLLGGEPVLVDEFAAS
jgi:G3E family GTPase